MEFLKKKHVEQQWYPNQLWISLNIMYTLKYGESPNTNANTPVTINMIQQPFPSLDFKGYINQLVIG